MTLVTNRYGSRAKNVRYTPPEFGRTPETVADVLEAAACVLDEEGRWAQGYWFHHKNQTMPEYREDPYCNGWAACADGALQIVSVGLFDYVPEGDDGTEADRFPNWTHSGNQFSDADEVAPMWELYEGAVNVMHAAIRRELNLPVWESCGIVGFNDTNGRTRTEVVEMMRKAAADARANDTRTHAASTAPPVPA